MTISHNLQIIANVTMVTCGGMDGGDNIGCVCEVEVNDAGR